MPSKKKKYNARFPAGRIKKIMQSDEEIGKVAQAVPVIIYIPRTLELFVDSLLTKTLKITNTRNAKTLSPTHLKQCIMAEQRFDFLRELVKNIPDISLAEEAAANYNEDDVQSSPEQDSLSDAASETNKSSDVSQRPTSSIHITTAALNMSRNGLETKQNGMDLTKMRRTRSMQQFEQQQQQQKTAIELDVMERLQNSVLKHATNTSISNSVIMHTNALLPKLLRAESTPELESCSAAKRSRQSSAATKATSPPNTPKTAPPSTATIPAPIVSFNFCSKPVVKIDYSNIPIAVLGGGDEEAQTTRTLPQSAPLQMTVGNCEQQSAFDFNTPPISINIDLSSIKINDATASCSSASISNANNSNTMPKSGKICSRTNSAVKTVTAKNTQLDLDEDYDNI